MSLQICDIFSFHVNGKRIDCRFKNPYCTIDFAKFCRQLNSKNKANFLKASVINIEQGELFKVFTSNGSFLSKYVVDATGYRASIAKLLKRCYVHNDALSFGIETEVPYRTKDFHFFYEPSFIKDGVAWLFPCGEFSRFGVASYKGETKLLDKLDLFLQRYNLKRQKVHGGFFCYCFKEPVVENVFVVGCAQGQTLPLTGEGIRRCIFFGIKCGEIIQRILDRRINLNEGINEYSNLALKARRDFNFLLAAQNRLLKMSDISIFRETLS
jgi:flavin-dependent dehydrogenase